MAVFRAKWCSRCEKLGFLACFRKLFTLWDFDTLNPAEHDAWCVNFFTYHASRQSVNTFLRKFETCLNFLLVKRKINRWTDTSEVSRPGSWGHPTVLVLARIPDTSHLILQWRTQRGDKSSPKTRGCRQPKLQSKDSLQSGLRRLQRLVRWLFGFSFSFRYGQEMQSAFSLRPIFWSRWYLDKGRRNFLMVMNLTNSKGYPRDLYRWRKKCVQMK